MDSSPEVNRGMPGRIVGGAGWVVVGLLSGTGKAGLRVCRVCGLEVDGRSMWGRVLDNVLMGLGEEGKP